MHFLTRRCLALVAALLLPLPPLRPQLLPVHPPQLRPPPPPPLVLAATLPSTPLLAAVLSPTPLPLGSPRVTHFCRNRTATRRAPLPLAGTAPPLRRAPSPLAGTAPQLRRAVTGGRNRTAAAEVGSRNKTRACIASSAAGRGLCQWRASLTPRPLPAFADRPLLAHNYGSPIFSTVLYFAGWPLQKG